MKLRSSPSLRPEKGKSTMNQKKGLIVGCVLGVSSQPFSDWNWWQLPLLLRYCPERSLVPIDSSGLKNGAA